MKKEENKYIKSIVKGGLIGICVGSIVSNGLIVLTEYRLTRQQEKSTKEMQFQEEKKMEAIVEKLQYNSIPLSQEAIDAIRNISNYSVDNEYINKFGINKETATSGYGNYFFEREENQPEEVIVHENNSYYNLQTGNIDWDGLVPKIYKNSIKKIKELEEKEENTWNYESCTKEEIEQKIGEFKDFTLKLKKDFPKYNLEKLACKLENYSLIKTEKKNEIENQEILGTTSSDTITYYNYKNQSEDRMKATDLHEDFHVLARSCDDDYELNNSGGSIDVITSTSNKNGDYDKFSYNRYGYSFLEEIYAELYSSEYNESLQSSYLANDEVLELLQLTLGLQDSYQIDSILKDIVYQDPKSFIEHFKIPGKDVDQEQYYLDTLKMLKAYDLLLNNSWNRNRVELLCDLPSFYEEGTKYLFDTAERQICKLFFNNLIVMNETHKEEMTLENNVNLYGNFVSSLNEANLAIKNNNPEMYEDEYPHTLSGIFTETRDIYFNYLCERYQLNQEELELSLHGYREKSLPNFMNEEKKEYYNNLTETSADWSEPSTRQLVKENRH